MVRVRLFAQGSTFKSRLSSNGCGRRQQDRWSTRQSLIVCVVLCEGANWNVAQTHGGALDVKRAGEINASSFMSCGRELDASIHLFDSQAYDLCDIYPHRCRHILLTISGMFKVYHFSRHSRECYSGPIYRSFIHKWFPQCPVAEVIQSDLGISFKGPNRIWAEG